MAKILIIDDEPELCRAYSIFLRRANPDYEVVTASCGEEGVQKAIREDPDLIILDLGLPDVSGVYVGVRLRDEGVLPCVPLIIVSGAVDQIDEAAEFLNATAFLVKPFDAIELISAVGEALAAE